VLTGQVLEQGIVLPVVEEYVLGSQIVQFGAFPTADFQDPAAHPVQALPMTEPKAPGMQTQDVASSWSPANDPIVCVSEGHGVHPAEKPKFALKVLLGQTGKKRDIRQAKATDRGMSSNLFRKRQEYLRHSSATDLQNNVHSQRLVSGFCAAKAAQLLGVNEISAKKSQSKRL